MATATYGQLVGIAETLLFTPGVITISLATALVPAISDALARQNISLVRTRTQEAIRLTILTGLPSAVVLLLLSQELCGFLFGYPEAAIALNILSFGGPFLYLQQTTTGILQGLGLAARPFRNLVISSIVKITILYYLTGLPSMGIKGAAIALSTHYFLTACLNYIDLSTTIGLKKDFKIASPIFATAGMAFVLWQSKTYLPALIEPPCLCMLAELFVSMITYFILLLITGGIHKHELARFKAIIRLR